MNDGPVTRAQPPRAARARSLNENHATMALEAMRRGLVIEASAVAELRGMIRSQMTNAGILASFLCALANAIYVEPPAVPHCLGRRGLDVVLVIEWIAMGCFFVTIMTSVVLSSDVDGVPDDMLHLHLCRASVQYLHALPQFMTLMGTLFLAIGYGLDIGERLGCFWTWMGIGAAMGFVTLVIAIGALARSFRQELNTDEPAAAGQQTRRALGVSIFTTWVDRYKEIEQHAVKQVRPRRQRASNPTLV